MPEKFIIESPDPYLKENNDMGQTKFGHINHMLHQMNNNEYANNAAAKAAGLKKGDFFRKTGTSELHIVHD
tara:strand:+ start:238 stop:450 length:213 start_codon:yes stop_codon:yes gene_type:complete